jgi:xylan 1,4-beta-xylosidase
MRMTAAHVARAACAAAFALAPLAAPLRGQSAPVARFDWVDYAGNDSAYRVNPPKHGEYANPVISGFHPDPSVIRVGENYYLVNSSFSYYPGVPIFRSRDLVHWTQIGNVLDRPSQLPLEGLQISRGVFAPAISYHSGTYYMINTCVECGGNFVVTAKNPAGPWSERIFLPEVTGIDPSLFFDDDGRAYVINNDAPVGTPRYGGHRALWLQEFDIASQRMKGPRTVVVDGGADPSRNPIWIEGPHIFRHDGHYYLIAAEGGTEDHHSEVVFRSDSVRGPYRPGPANPILTQRTLPVAQQSVSSTGHAEFVQTPRGDWWAVFLGARPYAPDTYNTGRETFLLPVSWRDGWPTIDGATGPIAFTHAAPVAPTSAATVPTWGNFRVRDDFTEASLPLYWNFIRKPGQSWYDLTSARGWLTIHPQPDDLNGRGAPSFVGRRQQHTTATISTAMRFGPVAAGDRAGLVAFQNEMHNYCLCVALDSAGKRVVRIERSSTDTGAAPIILASAPLAGASGETVYLKIDLRGGKIDFSYAERPNAWTLLAKDVDGTFLSTKVAGGFVGTLLGPYARRATP